MEKIIFNEIDKKGISSLIAVSLLIIFIIVVGFFIFNFASRSIGEESQKGADRANAQDICMEQVKIRINEVRDAGADYIINIENLKQRSLSDFLIRYEFEDEIEIKKARQFLGAYENANIPIEKPRFETSVIKIIPQIVLENELNELQTAGQGWWLCSEQIAIWSL
ncbi:hypothetical protein HYT56_01735 [Candidatus Woesearchaeota archaeon]|nr:hypothetical protein [Candidatus Woesearchaeota archaeon]